MYMYVLIFMYMYIYVCVYIHVHVYRCIFRYSDLSIHGYLEGVPVVQLQVEVGAEPQVLLHLLAQRVQDLLLHAAIHLLLKQVEEDSWALMMAAPLDGWDAVSQGSEHVLCVCVCVCACVCVCV